MTSIGPASDKNQPYSLIDPPISNPSIIEMVEAFHIKHTLDSMPIDPSNAIITLRVVKKHVSELPDSVWESIRFAPNVLGVQQTSKEEDLSPAQQVALSLVVDFVSTRKTKTAVLLYAVQALNNPLADITLLPEHVKSIMSIVEKYFGSEDRSFVDIVAKEHRTDVLNGLRHAYTAYSGKSETEHFLNILNQILDPLLIQRIVK